MDDLFRMKLEAAIGALGFTTLTPAKLPRFEEWKGKLSAEIEAAKMHAQLFGDGRDTSRSTVALKDEDRALILGDVRALVKVGRTVAEEVKTSPTYWRVGSPTQSEQGLLVRGKQFVAFAREHQDVFAGYGITAERLDAMTARLQALEERITAKNSATAQHVVARESLAGVAKRLVRALQALDAIYAQEFIDRPELLAAWRGTTNIPWPGTKAARAAKAPPAPEKGGAAT